MQVLEKIPFPDIESIPLLIKDFLQNKMDGFENHLFGEENFQKKILEKKKTYTESQRKTLCKVLAEQHSSFNLSEKQKAHLENLAKENTFTIVTGHQLNLFSGPSFFIYKILQTIKSAEFLSKIFPDFNFVPIFWLASEDHDFLEINHFKTETHFYEILGKSGGAVGRMKIADNAFIKNFEEEFKDHIFGTELIRCMKESYASGKTLTEATKVLVQRLFSELGLLMLDGDNHELKAQMKEIFKNELSDFSLKNHSAGKVQLLTERYGKVQVNPRDINLFYLSETRNRIDFDGENYFIVDKNLKFSKEDIFHELEKFPEKFSPNALMRPVYQEKILPNVAYIGGNAEIMYWLELEDFFKKCEIPFPMLIPRNSILFLKEKLIKKAERLGLNIHDFFGSFAKIMNNKILQNNEISEVLETKEHLLKTHFSEIKSVAKLTDRTFENLVDAEETRQLKSFERMKKRLLRAEKIKQNEKLTRMQNLFLEIHPQGTWQERILNFSVFYADFGKDWVDVCYRIINVEKSELVIVLI